MKQTTDAKKGEAVLRKKLYEQQVLQKSICLDDEFSPREIEAIISERMSKTSSQIKSLRDKGVTISPYIEIGAERGQRSLVMENELGCEGAATDISFYSLKSCDYYHTLFGLKKMPTRICCDANYLPFLAGSIPFVFCYQTLHHFPDLSPVLQEIYRVLAPGGCLFFDEEPFQQKLFFPLYKVDKKYSQKVRQRNIVRRALDMFFGVQSCNEVEHGIIENSQISVKRWKACLRLFDKHIVRLRTFKICTNLFGKRNSIKLFLNNLLGGDICGVCYKSVEERNTITRQTSTVRDVIACPNCLKSGNSVETRLEWHDEAMLCPKCSAFYKNVDDVTLLLPPDLLFELYPELAVANIDV